MNAVRQRIVELSIIGKHRKLTAREAIEWEESRRCIINHEWKVAKVMNLMYAARLVKDWDWLMRLDKELKRLEGKEI